MSAEINKVNLKVFQTQANIQQSWSRYKCPTIWILNFSFLYSIYFLNFKMIFYLQHKRGKQSYHRIYVPLPTSPTFAQHSSAGWDESPLAEMKTASIRLPAVRTFVQRTQGIAKPKKKGWYSGTRWRCRWGGVLWGMLFFWSTCRFRYTPVN